MEDLIDFLLCQWFQILIASAKIILDFAHEYYELWYLSFLGVLSYADDHNCFEF